MSHPGAKVEILYSAAEIANRVAALAGSIAATLGPDLLVVAILKGSFIFAADLIRALHHAGLHPEIDFMTLSSYGTGTESSGQVGISRDVTESLVGRQVLLIDDILESGRTLAFARASLEARGAKVSLCVLLEKPGRRKAPIDADFIGFVCPDRFVVGYGLDFAHYYRELPYIGVIQSDGGTEAG